MKTIGKMIEGNAVCRDIEREIEEADQAAALSPVVSNHLKACHRCETFYDEQYKLRQIVAGLGTVAAPNDFEFRLRARLASEKQDAAKPFTFHNFSFGLRSTAVAALLLVGSASLIVSLRPATNDSFVGNVPINVVKPDTSQPEKQAPPVASITNETGAVAVNTDQSDSANDKLNPRNKPPVQKRTNSSGLTANQLALAGNRPKTRDIGSTPAKVLKADQLVAAAGHSVFPIDASPQALKVSLENGRGPAKTVSVPGVSFGSQRVLTQNPSPLLASSKGSW